MLDYPTCLKLKEAGFPQPDEPEGNFDSWTIRGRYGENYLKLSNGEIIKQRFDIGYTYVKEAVYIPTLEELIEFCGEKVLLYRGKTNCYAAKMDGIDETCFEYYIDDSVLEHAIGPTPSQALANLILAKSK